MDYHREIVKHCAEIQKCSQRGGRMLSVTDLVEAGTISVSMTAFLLKSISEGASFIVGAEPGGAGKTTVMCALLNFLPLKTDIIHTGNGGGRRTSAVNRRRCFLCHEIGQGSYYSYLWGEKLLDFFKLKDSGNIIVSNLHADTYGEARKQICMDNPVPEKLFNELDILLFLKVTGRQRRISAAYAKKGRAHVFLEERAFQPAENKELVPYIDFVEGMRRKKIRLMEEVRRCVVDFFLKTL